MLSKALQTRQPAAATLRSRCSAAGNDTGTGVPRMQQLLAKAVLQAKAAAVSSSRQQRAQQQTLQLQPPRQGMVQQLRLRWLMHLQKQRHTAHLSNRPASCKQHTPWCTLAVLEVRHGLVAAALDQHHHHLEMQW